MNTLPKLYKAHTADSLALHGWVKDGHKSYLHVSGLTLKYNCMTYRWESSDGQTFSSVKNAIWHLANGIFS